MAGSPSRARCGGTWSCASIAVLARRLARRASSTARQRRLRVTYPKQRLDGIDELVLDRKAHFDEIHVSRQHTRFVVTAGDLGDVDLGEFDRLLGGAQGMLRLRNTRRRSVGATDPPTSVAFARPAAQRVRIVTAEAGLSAGPTLIRRDHFRRATVRSMSTTSMVMRPSI